ncbi:hypothetical protein Bca4012_101114 [Brassica carinata]|uniref:Uncharacterized protein n=1 Tax=Brassica carinata TaxID=52824 RepID=A0A8X7PKX7_BRACI|nr:hypothetical protein Bca52824_083521 [Brassica carinata]
MKRKRTEGEVSNTYQSFAYATKAGLYVTPHDTLNRIPYRASARFCHQRTCTKLGCFHCHILKRSLLTYTRKSATPPQMEQDQNHSAGM